ncbi:MAG: hypothetical protein ABIA75_06730 [Candidatus Neomarinimicrobiota bacterium]
MEAFLIIAVFIASVVIVARPLLQAPIRQAVDPKLRTEALEMEKLMVYQQIKVADQEFELGLLSAEDYLTSRNQLKLEASRIIDQAQQIGR